MTRTSFPYTHWRRLCEALPLSPARHIAAPALDDRLRHVVVGFHERYGGGDGPRGPGAAVPGGEDASVWHTDTLWFDVAVVMTIFAFGNVLFGRFEEHKPRGRRVLKVALVLAVTVLLSATAGRAWAYRRPRRALARRGLGPSVLAAEARHQRLDCRAS